METKTQEVARRFTVHEYHRTAEAGILHEDDRVELVEGEIVEIAVIGSRHYAYVNRLNKLFMQQIEDAAVVRLAIPLAEPAHHRRAGGIGAQARSRDPGQARRVAPACRRRHDAGLYRAGETMGG